VKMARNLGTHDTTLAGLVDGFQPRSIFRRADNLASA
jgi:hypothetical protein